MSDDTRHLSPKTAAAVETLQSAGERGMTWRDYAALTGAHHGSASGMLSRLHRTGLAARLAEKRGTDSVYVHPEFAGDRATIAPKRRAPRATGIPEERLEAERRAAYAEGVADGRRHERDTAGRREAERYDAAKAEAVASAYDGGYGAGLAAGRAEWEGRLAEVTREAEERAEAVRQKAFAEGIASGRAHERDGADRRLAEREQAIRAEAAAKARGDALAEGRSLAEQARRDGYAKGFGEGEVKGRAEGARSAAAERGGEPFVEGREVGRREGRAAVMRDAMIVVARVYDLTRRQEPIQSHHAGCYTKHPSCAVKAVAQGLGIPPQKLRGDGAA